MRRKRSELADALELAVTPEEKEEIALLKVSF